MFVKDRRMRRVKSLFLVNLALDWTQFIGFLFLTELLQSSSSMKVLSLSGLTLRLLFMFDLFY